SQTGTGKTGCPGGGSQVNAISVNRVATVACSISSRASCSLTFVFSALIWSSIVNIVLGMVAFSSFRSIGMVDLGGVYHCNAGSSTALAGQKVVFRGEARTVG